MTEIINRPWYRKKTTWAITTIAISGAMKLNPFTAPLSEWVLTIGSIFGLYAATDRANKAMKHNNKNNK